MQEVKISTLFFICLLGLSLSNTWAQVPPDISGSRNQIDIPDEILSRIPSDQLAQFIQCRDRALMNHPAKMLEHNPYKEIGLSREVLSRIPEDQLFRFLKDRGYVELGISEDIVFDTTHVGGFHNGPSPKQVFSILYLLIGIAASIIALSTFLNYLKKRGDQQIIILALEQGSDIPYELIQGSHRRSYLRYAIILIVTGIGICIAGTFDVIPPALGIIPLSIGLGYIVAALAVRD